MGKSRKTYAREFKIDRERYRHLFEHAPICILVVDICADPATVVEVNRRTELVYGYAPAEMVGMPTSQLTSKETTPTIPMIIRQVRRGRIASVTAMHQRRDGTRFPARVMAVSAPADAGQMIITVEDITAERQRRSEAEAIDAERRRIAHEIHDSVAQSLAALRFKSALWSHQSHTSPTDMHAVLDELTVVLTDAITELRRVIFALRPVDLEALGFVPALTQLVEDFGDQNQLVARLEITGLADALPLVYELPLFRIVQEGLNNISQHARANSVLVRLTMQSDDGVVVAVCDNGRGFDPSMPNPVDRGGHFGLRQMRERILDLGGTLDIRSAPGQGTRLDLTLPSSPKAINHAAN